MSTDSWDRASSKLEELETYVRRLEEEKNSVEAVLTQLKHEFDQSSEDNDPVNESIVRQCSYVLAGGAC